ncbi:MULTISPECIES: type I-E CRISPR-associated endoribonuclease Cas2e [Streptomyces]|uniref:Type I-E CRISPR-associated endoribonuclease Cas2e n=1 Tax=Streptomyces evansiae TaxID=3075535 RepID=A0ABU2QUR8_9ACTN|nr:MULTISPECIES: type I-E CRISPR-associated endoribonuclease Cas2e [unclassified Streptomyces]MDT0407733.1 type I-E CRISPR-associated endoribonuclease Cas2e [Streptomyces sp. DSM 41979]MYQ61475.1 type I-E CRISPR-associated endoribonuclease Cas2 [Streptomyces sp. SID4926]SCE58943.1 CRISPR-associated protein Cas2 [Streptomyces sp. DfronAA-171]
MPAMTVISATAVPDHLRGALTRWLLEVTPTLYVGTISTRVRTELWNNLTACLTDGSAVLAYPTNNEQGFTLHTAGPQRRETVDFEGLTLIAFQRLPGSQESAKPF